MSEGYDNTDRGVLFKNNKKTKDTHPDMTGNINVGGTEFDLAAWKKVSKDGNTYVSMKVSPKRERRDGPSPKQAGRPARERPVAREEQELNDDIPF